MSKKTGVILCIVLAVILTVVLCVLVGILVSNPLERHVKKAVQHMNNGQYEDAVLEFDKAIAIEDKVPEIYYAKANAQILAGDDKGAKETTAIAIEITISGDAVDSDVKTHLIIVLDGKNNYISEKDLLKWWYAATEGMDEYDDLREAVAKMLKIEHVSDEDEEIPEDIDDLTDIEEEDEPPKPAPGKGNNVPKKSAPVSSAPDENDAPQTDAWRKAYEAYVKKNGSGAGNKLVDLNGDGTPEMYVQGKSRAEGNKILVYDPKTGTVKEKVVSGVLSYNEGGGNFKVSGGSMDVYHDDIYHIDEDYNVVESAKGNHNDYSYIDPEYEPVNDIDISYTWDGEEVSREEYTEKVNEYNDESTTEVDAYDVYDIAE